MTTALEEQLRLAEREFGKDSRFVQNLRDQVAAEKTGKSAEEIYVTGSVAPKREAPPR